MDENVTATTTLPLRQSESAEGLAIAYSSMLFMCMVPIFIGSFRSVMHQQQQLECSVRTTEDRSHPTSPRQDALSKQTPRALGYFSRRDAIQVPFFASCMLLGIYFVFKVSSKIYVNLLLTGYVGVLGVLALSQLICPVCYRLMPAFVPQVPFHILFTKGRPINSI